MASTPFCQIGYADSSSAHRSSLGKGCDKTSTLVKMCRGFDTKRKEAMTHRMMLVSHDFREVKAVVVARRKQNAGVAQAEERLNRNQQVGVSNTSLGSTFEERE